MRTRQTDGACFVSPIGTLLDGVIAGLEDLEEGDFENVFDPFAGVAGGAVLDPFDVLEDLNIDDGGSTASDTVVDDFDNFDDFGEESAVPGAVLEIAVASGESAQFEGQLAENVFDSFLIDLSAGESVTATAQANNSDLDTVLAIQGPLGEPVAENDDAFPSLPSGIRDSQASFIAESSGTYTVEVSGFSASDSGAYTLTIDRDTEPSITCLLYTSPSPRDQRGSRMPSSA